MSNESKMCGDMAKLREALESFMVGSCVYACVSGGYDENEDWCAQCLASPKGSGDCPYEKARKALAAPPRNCDVYTADELKVIFKRELASELPIANEHEKNLITITAMRMIDTLFATTKEGGSDGNK